MSIATIPAPTSSISFSRREPSERGALPLAVLRRIPEVEVLAGGLVASWHSSSASLQSRRSHRIRFQKRLVVTPLDDVHESPSGHSFTVMGHDISLTGLSFTHEEPLAERKVAVSFLFDDGPLDSVVTLLRWCRFRRDGFYQTGGLFLRAIALGDEATLSDRTALGDGACALPGPLSQGTPAY